MKVLSWLMVAALLPVTGKTLYAEELRLAGVFGDHGVLQRDQAVPVWGWADRGAVVSVSFAGQRKSATADTAGRWQVTLDAMPASAESRELVVTAGGQTLKRTDVVVGDVWLCGGQSNMAMALAACARVHPPLKKAMEGAKNPLLRLGSVPPSWPAEPLKDVACTWALPRPQAVYGFSAIGYLFGERLQREIGVPIGMINASRGGTWIENWMPREVVEAGPANAYYLGEYRKAMERYPEAKAQYDRDLAEFRQRFPTAEALAKEDAARRARGEAELKAPAEPRGPDSYNGPGRLFNGMIAPIASYALKGVLWYQGEGNVWGFSAYADQMADLVRTWRGLWGQPDLPFLMTELAPLGKPSPVAQDSARCRFGVALARGAGNAGRAWVITITDGGETDDIHPRYKEIPAERFAALALAKVYGRPGVCHGPMLDSWKGEGGKAVVRFSSAGSGLAARAVVLGGQELPAGKPVGFELAGADRRFFRATAEVQGIDTVVVSCPEVPAPAAVRYAWASFPLCNLYNKEGFAAYPFRTDDWPWQTPKP